MSRSKCAKDSGCCRGGIRITYAQPPYRPYPPLRQAPVGLAIFSFPSALIMHCPSLSFFASLILHLYLVMDCGNFFVSPTSLLAIKETFRFLSTNDRFCHRHAFPRERSTSLSRIVPWWQSCKVWPFFVGVKRDSGYFTFY